MDDVAPRICPVCNDPLPDDAHPLAKLHLPCRIQRNREHCRNNYRNRREAVRSGAVRLCNECMKPLDTRVALNVLLHPACRDARVLRGRIEAKERKRDGYKRPMCAWCATVYVQPEHDPYCSTKCRSQKAAYEALIGTPPLREDGARDGFRHGE